MLRGALSPCLGTTYALGEAGTYCAPDSNRCVGEILDCCRKRLVLDSDLLVKASAIFLCLESSKTAAPTQDTTSANR